MCCAGSGRFPSSRCLSVCYPTGPIILCNLSANYYLSALICWHISSSARKERQRKSKHMGEQTSSPTLIYQLRWHGLSTKLKKNVTMITEQNVTYAGSRVAFIFHLLICTRNVWKEILFFKRFKDYSTRALITLELKLFRFVRHCSPRPCVLRGQWAFVTMTTRGGAKGLPWLSNFLQCEHELKGISP